MQPSRPRAAQALMAFAVVGCLLTWETEPAVSGVSSDERTVALFAAFAAIGLIQIGWRPAWMAAGLALAIGGRRLWTLFDGGFSGVGIGLWIVVVASAAALVVLFVDMFTTIERAPPGSGDET